MTYFFKINFSTKKLYYNGGHKENCQNQLSLRQYKKTKWHVRQFMITKDAANNLKKTLVVNKSESNNFKLAVKISMLFCSFLDI